MGTFIEKIMNYSTPFELPTRKERFELEKWKHLNIKAEIEKNRVEHQKAINQKQKILKDLRPSLKCDKKIDYGELSVSLECQNSSKNGCATIEELEGKLKSVQNALNEFQALVSTNNRQLDDLDQKKRSIAVETSKGNSEKIFDKFKYHSECNKKSQETLQTLLTLQREKYDELIIKVRENLKKSTTEKIKKKLPEDYFTELKEREQCLDRIAKRQNELKRLVRERKQLDSNIKDAKNQIKS